MMACEAVGSTEEEIVRFFSRSPGSLPLFAALRERILDAYPGTSVRTQKSQIAFAAGRSFAYAWLPIRKVRGRPDVYIIVSFGLNRRIESPRVAGSVEPYSGRHMHHVIVSDASQIDTEIMGWLREAFEQAKSGNRRKQPEG